MAADRAAARKKALFPGKAAGRAADRRKGFSAFGAVFCVQRNFSAAAFTEKAGRFGFAPLAGVDIFDSLNSL